MTKRGDYSVNLWGSDPNEENDDCWEGHDFKTEAEARAVFDAADPITAMAEGVPEERRDAFIGEYRRDAVFIEIDGPGVNESRRLRRDRPRRADDGEWRREHAMQEGMMGGCEAYNDAMGWS